MPRQFRLYRPVAKRLPAAATARHVAGGVALGLAVLLVVAYANTGRAPFVFDDEGAILRNPTIHQWTWATLNPFAQPGGVTTAGRPVLNLSFALNQVVSGDAPWSYHVFNLLIHMATGALLYGLLRRVTPHRAPAAAAVALWLLHPLQTEAVTYSVQRAEALMAFFYVLTVYAFARAAASTATAPAPSARRWFGLSVAACALGMGTKEVMVTAPVVVLLFDRVFLSGGFRAALARHRAAYFGLTSTWLLLGVMVLGTGGNRGGTIGFGVRATWWPYIETQFAALARYARLAAWPYPLTFEYGTIRIDHFQAVLWPAVGVAAAVAVTLFGLRRWPRASFPGAAALLILAPTSLVPGTMQMIVEHRAYLPLAAVAAAAALAGHALVGRRIIMATVGIALAFTLLTAARNRDYRSEVALWHDTVTKRPQNALAHYNLGHALAETGEVAGAIPHYRAALALKPDYAEAHQNLGNALSRLGRVNEAVGEYEAALRLRSDYANAYYNLGCALTELHRWQEALTAFERSLRLQPESPEVHYNYAAALALAGRPDDAVRHYRAAIATRPGYVDARINLANLLAQLHRREEALTEFMMLVRVAPESADAHAAYANALAETGQSELAVDEYASALRLRPGFAVAHYNFALVLAQLGRLREAAEHDAAALRLNPDFTYARDHLAWIQRASPPEEKASHEAR